MAITQRSRQRRLMWRIWALPEWAQVLALLWLACGQDRDLEALAMAMGVAEEAARRTGLQEAQR